MSEAPSKRVSCHRFIDMLKSEKTIERAYWFLQRLYEREPVAREEKSERGYYLDTITKTVCGIQSVELLERLLSHATYIAGCDQKLPAEEGKPSTQY